MHLSVKHKNTIQIWTTAVTVDWLSRHNNETNSDQVILGMNITINASHA